MPINYVTTSGADVADLADAIEDVVQGYPNSLVCAACIVVAVIAQDPEVSAVKLEECVRLVSEQLSALLHNESPTKAVN